MYLPYKDFLSRNPELYSLLHTKKVIDNKRRVSYCEKYLKGKKILNIGCLNHDIANYNQQHDEILTLGKQVIGVDIIEDAKRIKGDIEIWDINDETFISYLLEKYGQFDIIFAGELIEHLDNYKIFFTRLHKLLIEDGLFIISTPNPQGLHYFSQVFLHKYLPYGNIDHTVRIDIFQLVFNIQKWYKLIDYIHLNPRKSIEQIVIYICKKPHLSMNYLAVFQKIWK